MPWVGMPQVGTGGRLGGSDACGDGQVGQVYVIKSLSLQKQVLYLAPPFPSGLQVDSRYNLFWW